VAATTEAETPVRRAEPASSLSSGALAPELDALGATGRVEPPDGGGVTEATGAPELADGPPLVAGAPTVVPMSMVVTSRATVVVSAAEAPPFDAVQVASAVLSAVHVQNTSPSKAEAVSN
jgi:hypothetical protein